MFKIKGIEVSGITQVVINKAVLFDRYHVNSTMWFYHNKKDGVIRTRDSESIKSLVHDLVNGHGYRVRIHESTINLYAPQR